MMKLNLGIVSNNISEAREQLQQIEFRLQSDNAPSEIELKIMLRHAYHHMNFAWNIRHIPTAQYAHLTDDEFARWGRYPQEIEED